MKNSVTWAAVCQFVESQIVALMPFALHARMKQSVLVPLATQATQGLLARLVSVLALPHHSIVTLHLANVIITILVLAALPPPIEPGCDVNQDCPEFNACRNQRCIDPCIESNPCARNAFCKVIQHEPDCTCPPGFIGDPFIRCEPPRKSDTSHQSDRPKDMITMITNLRQRFIQ